MCIIIYKPVNIRLYDTTIKNCFENNSDGAGFAYVENEQIYVQKGFFNIETFQEAYEPHKLKQALLHFRIKTHGNLEATNCHPLHISEQLVFAHNGIIYQVPKDEEKSDSVLFNELILQNLIRVFGTQIIFDKTIQTLIKAYVYSSRLVFLDNKGQVHITNEKEGKWVSDCWFSNNSWQKAKPIYIPPSRPIPQNQQTYGQQTYPTLSKNQQKKLAKQQRRLQQTTGTNVVPIHTATSWNKSGLPLVIGDYVRMSLDINGSEKGWMGKIMGFYENHHVEVYFPLHKRILKIPIIYLEPML